MGVPHDRARTARPPGAHADAAREPRVSPCPCCWITVQARCSI